VAGQDWLGIELRHLAALEAIAREGSFARAATSLGYTRSAVSSQVATLERIVGARLVDRSRGPNGVTLTDSGAAHVSRAGADTARAEVTPHGVVLSQYIAQIAAGDPPLVLKGGEEFSFRAGISVGPNRLPNPRTPELRMFIWIGDAKYPYPTDAEITQVAHWGYTMFQLHRVGTVGEPRPPAGELERVIRKVHELGMLFLWEENADLIAEMRTALPRLLAEVRRVRSSPGLSTAP